MSTRGGARNQNIVCRRSHEISSADDCKRNCRQIFLFLRYYLKTQIVLHYKIDHETGRFLLSLQVHSGRQTFNEQKDLFEQNDTHAILRPTFLFYNATLLTGCQ